MTTKRNPATKLGEIKPCGSPWSRLRAERGWSLETASRAGNLPLTALCEIETGARAPGLKTLQKLARLYAITLDEAQKLSDLTAKWRTRRALVAA